MCGNSLSLSSGLVWQSGTPSLLTTSLRQQLEARHREHDSLPTHRKTSSSQDAMLSGIIRASGPLCARQALPLSADQHIAWLMHNNDRCSEIGASVRRTVSCHDATRQSPAGHGARRRQYAQACRPTTGLPLTTGSFSRQGRPPDRVDRENCNSGPSAERIRRPTGGSWGAPSVSAPHRGLHAGRGPSSGPPPVAPAVRGRRPRFGTPARR